MAAAPPYFSPPTTTTRCKTPSQCSDPTLPAAHSEGQAALEADDYVDADQLAHAMGEAGRLPQ
jgi:hypothetical protein